MTPRERLLTALSNGKPDRLPTQVCEWMRYYLDTYLDGCNQYEAYRRFGMDSVVYADPKIIYADTDRANWVVERRDLGTDAEGNHFWAETVTTPEGTLTHRGACNAITEWKTEFLIKSKRDFELFEKYALAADRLDPAPVIEAREKVGDQGIVRGCILGYGQGSPWQDFCCLVDTEKAIYYAMDEPDWVHHVLEVLLDKRMRYIERLERTPLDLIIAGGGAGSNTVISPALFRAFCLPYDRQQNDALNAIGIKVVYHLCGGLMQMLELVVENGADGLETMTPPGMGGDCDLAEATRRVGDKLFFAGGFDQREGFERGTPERVRELVFELHAACPDGGYVCSPSDHFFHGDPANVQAFADAAKECIY